MWITPGQEGRTIWSAERACGKRIGKQKTVIGKFVCIGRDYRILVHASYSMTALLVAENEYKVGSPGCCMGRLGKEAANKDDAPKVPVIIA